MNCVTLISFLTFTLNLNLGAQMTPFAEDSHGLCLLSGCNYFYPFALKTVQVWTFYINLDGPGRDARDKPYREDPTRGSIRAPSGLPLRRTL